MADDKEVRVDPMTAADQLAELDGGKTTPGPVDSAAAETATNATTAADAILAEANAEVPLPVAMSPAEVDARGDAVEAVEEAIEEEIEAEGAPTRTSLHPNTGASDIHPDL